MLTSSHPSRRRVLIVRFGYVASSSLPIIFPAYTPKVGDTRIRLHYVINLCKRQDPQNMGFRNMKKIGIADFGLRGLYICTILFFVLLFEF